MDKSDALKEIQKMDETKLITRKSITAWYYIHSDKLPEMHPERTRKDLIRIIYLWMILTDDGINPPFPYSYKTNLDFSLLKRFITTRPSKPFVIGLLSVLLGMFLLFKVPVIGICIIFLSPFTLILTNFLQGHKLRNLTKVHSLDKSQIKRVFEWSKQQKK